MGIGKSVGIGKSPFFTIFLELVPSILSSKSNNFGFSQQPRSELLALKKELALAAQVTLIAFGRCMVQEFTLMLLHPNATHPYEIRETSGIKNYEK